MLERLRLQLRRLRLRDTCCDHNYYYETCLPNGQKRYRLRRRVYSSPSLRRRHTYTSSSDSSDSDPEDLYWIQSARARARAKTFHTHNPRSNFITVDMDGDRPRGFWRSFFGSEYFDVFQRRKRETRSRYEEERPRPRPRQPRDPYPYARSVDPRYRDEYRWESPRIDPLRRAPSPPLGRPPPRRGVSLPRRVVRSRSPQPRLRPRSDELPRRDIRRPHESVYTRPKTRPPRPPSPVNERVPPRRGRRTSPFPPASPSSRSEVIIIHQRNPRAISPQTRPYPSSQPVPSRPQHAEFQTHNSVRERISRRKRIHSPEATSPPRSRKVRFVEGHEEISGPVCSNSNSDSSSDSDSDSPPRASSQPRPRSRSRSRLPVVVVVQPQRESSTRIVERSPRSIWAGGERRVSGLNAGLMRGSGSNRGQGRERVGSEGVMYVYREPRGQGRRVRDSRRYV